jgi:hypothetical protein
MRRLARRPRGVNLPSCPRLQTTQARTRAERRGSCETKNLPRTSTPPTSIQSAEETRQAVLHTKASASATSSETVYTEQRRRNSPPVVSTETSRAAKHSEETPPWKETGPATTATVEICSTDLLSPMQCHNAGPGRQLYTRVAGSVMAYKLRARFEAIMIWAPLTDRTEAASISLKTNKSERDECSAKTRRRERQPSPQRLDRPGAWSKAVHCHTNHRL